MGNLDGIYGADGSLSMGLTMAGGDPTQQHIVGTGNGSILEQGLSEKIFAGEGSLTTSWSSTPQPARFSMKDPSTSRRFILPLRVMLHSKDEPLVDREFRTRFLYDGSRTNIARADQWLLLCVLHGRIRDVIQTKRSVPVKRMEKLISIAAGVASRITMLQAMESQSLQHVAQYCGSDPCLAADVLENTRRYDDGLIDLLSTDPTSAARVVQARPDIVDRRLEWIAATGIAARRDR